MKLQPISRTPQCSIYALPAEKPSSLTSLVASTPETRMICNDPLVMGVRYTRLLQTACTRILSTLNERRLFDMAEIETIVFHVLRGGLNFGLREALADAYGWNRHGSAFISAQRARNSKGSEDWHITESDYKKVYLTRVCTAVVGDVVATGTSLEHALHELLNALDQQGAQLKSLLFFTFGGSRAHEIIQEVDTVCRARFDAYTGSTIIYLEGCFKVAQIDTPLTIRITGTDLLRSGSTMCEEFLESQYDSPSYPIERCVIYDAGSRAFWLPEYLADVEGYWRETLSLAEKRMSYAELLQERFGELDGSRFNGVDLKDVCLQQLARIEQHHS